MTPPDPLQLIQGNRAALELEALLSIPHDFQKFLAIARQLGSAANDAFGVALEVTPKADGDEFSASSSGT